MKITVINRTIEKADRLIRKFGNMTKIRSEVEIDKPFDLVINGSSAGLTGNFFPEENIPLTSKTYFYDLNYSLTETPFCKWANEKSDNVYEPSEISSIDTELSQHFSISIADAAVLRQQAEKLEQEAPDTVRFTRAIKEKIELEKRRKILETLWKITLADGKREAEEDSVIRLISSLLGLTDIESARARQKVTKK